MNRWMRKNQMLVLYFIIIFILPTFAISGAIYAFLDYRGSTVGSFEVEPGDRVRVTDTKFRAVRDRIRPWYNSADADIVWMHLVLLREAENAGIRVSDEEVASRSLASVRKTSVQEYRKALAEIRLKPAQWEKTMREVLMIGRYQQLMISGSRVLEDELFERFQQQNQRRKFEFVGYRTEDYLAEFNPTDFEKDEVLAFWNKPQNGAIRAKKRIPQRFDLKVVSASFNDFDCDAAGGLAAGVEVTDDEIQACYDDPMNQERWMDSTDEDSTDEDSTDEDSTDEDSADEDSTEADSTDEAAAEPTLRPLEEIRDAIEREIRLHKVLEKVRDQALEVQQKVEEAKAWKEGESEGERPEVVPLDLEKLAGDQQTGYDVAKELTAEELETFATKAAGTFSINPFGLKDNELSDVRTGADGSSYFFLLEGRLRPTDPPFEEIEAEARELLSKDKAFQKAKENAEAMTKALRKAVEMALAESKPDFVREEEEEQERGKAEQERKKADQEEQAAAKRKELEEFDAKAAEASANFDEVASELFPDQEGRDESVEVATSETDDGSGDDSDGLDGDEPDSNDPGEEAKAVIDEVATADESAATEDSPTTEDGAAPEETAEEEAPMIDLGTLTPEAEELETVTSLASWNELLEKYLGRAFDEFVKAEGLEVVELGPTKRLSPLDEEYDAESSEEKKFLLTNGQIHGLEENRTIAVLNHPDKDFVFVVKVVTIELPDYSEVTAEDRDRLVPQLAGRSASQLQFSMGIYAQRYPQMAGQVLLRARLETEQRTPPPNPQQQGR